MSTIVDWISHLQHAYAVDLVRSLALILILVIARVTANRFLSNRKNLNIEDKRKLSIAIRNSLFVLGLACLVTIWAQELETIAISMVAFAAAMVVATKELIMCFAGAILRSVSGSYTLGDHIEVAQYRGRVVDMTPLTTTVMEIGPGHNAHQITGRAVVFPNSLLLSNAVIKENYMGDYVVHVISVPVAYTLYPKEAVAKLIDIANTYCSPYLSAAKAYMDKLESQHLMDMPSIDPRVSIKPVDEKSYMLILRVAIPAKERQRLEQAILKDFLFAVYTPTSSEPVSADSLEKNDKLAIQVISK